jgi:hypothetical protein
MLGPKDLEIEQLKARIATLEAQIRGLGCEPRPANDNDNDKGKEPQSAPQTRPLKAGEYVRYGRQMILPGFGLPCESRASVPV